VSQMVDHVLALPPTSDHDSFAAIVAAARASSTKLVAELRAQGSARLRVDGKVHESTRCPGLENVKHSVDVCRPAEGRPGREAGARRVVRDGAAPTDARDVASWRVCRPRVEVIGPPRHFRALRMGLIEPRQGGFPKSRAEYAHHPKGRRARQQVAPPGDRVDLTMRPLGVAQPPVRHNSASRCYASGALQPWSTTFRRSASRFLRDSLAPRRSRAPCRRRAACEPWARSSATSSCCSPLRLATMGARIMMPASAGSASSDHHLRTGLRLARGSLCSGHRRIRRAV